MTLENIVFIWMIFVKSRQVFILYVEIPLTGVKKLLYVDKIWQPIYLFLVSWSICSTIDVFITAVFWILLFKIVIAKTRLIHFSIYALKETTNRSQFKSCNLTLETVGSHQVLVLANVAEQFKSFLKNYSFCKHQHVTGWFILIQDFSFFLAI